MAKREVTFVVDSVELFDRLHAMKGDTSALGTRLVECLLADAHWSTHIGLAIYGIEVKEPPRG